MAGPDIARGQITIDLNDRDALNGLNRLRAEYAAAMASIDRMKADVTLGANTVELDAELKKAKDKVRILRGEKADIKIGADSKELDAEIAAAEALVKKLDGKKARIQIETRGGEAARAQLEAVRKLEAKRAAEENKFARQRLQLAQQEARSRASLERQRLSEMANTEKAAYRENEQRRLAGVNIAREAREVVQLQQEYAKLTDKLENLHRRQGRTFGREPKAKLELETAAAEAHMDEVMARLRAKGKHPPVNIRVDTDQGFFKRQLFGLRKTAEGFLNNFSQGFGKAKINLGPLSISLRALIGVLATLGPLVVDVSAALVGLIGVLGTGLAGAAAVGGGILAGLALNFGGVFAAVKPVATEFKTAMQATSAYHKALLQYGAGSKQAATAQAKMNEVLKNSDPIVRKVAQASGHLGAEWRKLTTESAHRNVGKILAEGVKTLDKLMPTLARNTNQTFDILGHRVGNLMKSLRTPAAVKIFDSLGKSANNFLDPMLRGLGHLGAAFGHIAEAAARIFAGPAGRGFNRWASDIDKATQPGNRLDAQIRKIGRNASELMHFFSALGRVITTVLNGGSRSGERMTVSMTKALNRWNEFLKSPRGRTSMADFFTRAEKGARSLWGALAPLIASFVQWSNLLSPLTAGILKGIGFVANLVAAFTKLIGLGGPLAALGATIGVVFAVSKLAAFASLLGRIVTLMRAAAAAGGVMAGAKTFFGGIGGALRGPGSMASGGAAAGAEIRAAMIQGGGAAAAEIRAAMIGGGAAAAGESALAGGAAGVAGGTRSVNLLKGIGGGAAAAETGMLGLSAATLGVGAALAVATGAILYFHGKAMGLNETTKSLLRTDDAMNKAISDTAASLQDASRNAVDAQQSHLNLANAQREYNRVMKDGKATHAEQRQALLNLRQAELDDIDAKKRWRDQANAIGDAEKKQVQTARDSIDVRKKELAVAKQAVADAHVRGSTPADIAKKLQDQKNAQAAYNASLGEYVQAQARARVADLNRQRALALLPQLSSRAAQALQKLAQTAGGKGVISQQIALRFTNPAGVAQAATTALRSGVPKSLVLNIVANSKNAEDAIKKINAARIALKHLRIDGDPSGATAAHNRVRGLRNVAKVLTILGNIGPALAGHRRVSAFGNLFKILTVLGNSTPALSAYNALKGLGDIVKNLIIRTVHQGKASGGPWMPEEKQAQRIAQRAQAAGQRTTVGGRYSRPTLLVGEEDRTEYVIATNPAYRSANVNYLAAAAADLGYNIEPAAGGKKPKKNKSTAAPRHDHHAPGYHKMAKLPLIGSDSIRSDYIDSYHNDTLSAYNKIAGNVNSLERQIDRLNNQYRDTKAGGAGAGQRQSITRHLARLNRELRVARHKAPGARARERAATKVYNEYNNDKNMIDALASRMDVDAKLYNSTGDAGYLNDWNNLHDQRDTLLSAIYNLVHTAKGRAGKKYQSDLDKTLADIEDQQATASVEEGPAGPAVMDLTSFIDSLGRTGELARDIRAVAETRANLDPADDQPALQGVADFYKSIYDAALAAGAPDALVTEAANAYADARDAASPGGSSLNPDAQALLDQTQRQLEIMTTSNAINAAAVSAFGSPGDIGTGVFSNAYAAARYEAGGGQFLGSPAVSSPGGGGTPARDGGPTTIINVHTLHPGDPETLLAIGRAATGGLSMQGSVISPRTRTGI